VRLERVLAFGQERLSVGVLPPFSGEKEMHDERQHADCLSVTRLQGNYFW